MGLSMCSQQDGRTKRSNISSYQFIDQWYAPEEVDEEERSVSFAKIGKSMSMPKDFNRDSRKSFLVERAASDRASRVRGYSLEERMQNRNRSSAVNREGERSAQQYAKIVTDDTLKHIRHSVRLARSIVQKGEDINEELARQERVLCSAENDMSTVEYDTDITSQTLKGMTSLRGKIATTIKRKKPKRKKIPLSEVNVDIMNGQFGLCASSRMVSRESSLPKITESLGHTPQQEIRSGIKHLHNALDDITVQQLDTAWALQRQEGRLSIFEGNLDRTHGNINQQRQMINKIMGKS